MPLHYDIETDYLYLKGIEAGRKKVSDEIDHRFVTNLLCQTDLSDDKIAHLAVVTLAYVQKVRSELE